MRVAGKILSGLALLFSGTLLAAERDLVLEPMEAGVYAVGSTNFTIDEEALSAALNAGVDGGVYQEGGSSDGQLVYISSLLAFPDAAFSFELQVPDDATLYGSAAGGTMPYAGYVLYPTADSNTRAGYQVLSGYEMPHMAGEGEAPLFADADAEYPVLVYSHGDGGHPGLALESLASFASHGYIVMALYHGDRRFADTDPQRFNLRPLAIKTALDELLADSRFQGHIDTDAIGGLGESYGGATMLALLGAKKLNPDAASVIANNLLTTTVDTRIRAAATIVPYMGQGQYTMFGRNFNGTSTVDRPFMANSGNVDQVADFDYVTRAMENIPGVKYLVEYDQEGHSMSLGAVSDALTWGKVFLDAFVRKDEVAIAQLSRLSSVSDGGVDSLALVSEPESEPEPEPEPEASSAGFAGGKLTLDDVAVGGKIYAATLTLVPGSSPYRFTLSSAAVLSATLTSENAFAGGVLVLPEVKVGSKLYSVELTRTASSPVMEFTLTKASVLP